MPQAEACGYQPAIHAFLAERSSPRLT